MSERIMHVVLPGYHCHNPYNNVKAKDVRNRGITIREGRWILAYYDLIQAYGVHPAGERTPFYEFRSFDCAAAKLCAVTQKATAIA